ncbi:MAG: general secretion pathway protein GspB [Gammaproteobacteria bacterium]|nr:general secretion pathway protein GspB [Gammaproteobacteria bacterium]
MSYILDALKRAEQERHIGQMPNAAAAPAADDYFDEPRRWPWLVLLFVVLAVIVAAVAYWLAGAGNQAVTRPVQSSVQSTSAPTAAAVEVYSEPEASLPTRVTAVTLTPQVIEQTAPLSSAAEVEEAPQEAVKSDLASQPTEASAAFAEPAPQFEPASEPKVAEQSEASFVEPVPAPAPAPEPVAVAEESPSHSLPWLKEMSPSFRRSVPNIDIQFHRYTDNRSRSFVMVDGVRYREGQILKSGPTVERIVEEGLVLRWQGERFVYPIGG